MPLPTQTEVPRPRRLLISGPTGLIGSHFIARHRAAHPQDTIVRLTRGAPAADSIQWSPGSGTLTPEAVSGFDAVIHLAGEPVVGRWTAEKKRRIRDSRVQGTTELASALARAAQPPRVFLSASGINFYGSHRDQLVDESSARGQGFLADVCGAWEAAAHPLEGIARIVNLRIGVVLSRDGGTLAAMLPIFRAGLGGTFGGGRGYVSWISLADALRAIEFALDHEQIGGPVNVVSPKPVTGKELTQDLAAALHRPAIFGVPAWAARLLLGQLADETVLGSVRASPGKLASAGFQFHDTDLGSVLRQAVSTRSSAEA